VVWLTKCLNPLTSKLRGEWHRTILHCISSFWENGTESCMELELSFEQRMAIGYCTSVQSTVHSSQSCCLSGFPILTAGR
ncbi:hypothetical protein LINGRAPRIM_LOCUS1642, partial [Linum grandiflorum]